MFSFDWRARRQLVVDRSVGDRKVRPDILCVQVLVKQRSFGMTYYSNAMSLLEFACERTPRDLSFPQSLVKLDSYIEHLKLICIWEFYSIQVTVFKLKVIE